MPNIGPMELILIFLVVVLLFGGKKIPEIAKGLGKGIRDFKSSLAGTDEKDESKTLAASEKAAQDAKKS
ncbi:MAG TPA: twin-arginine translocase TatA/TatE family subunit [Fibrobacteria bacterium]|nr:twin-arginine translocase TatA/TatE family subunit [Fibrobacteria bacterium]